MGAYTYPSSCRRQHLPAFPVRIGKSRTANTNGVPRKIQEAFQYESNWNRSSHRRSGESGHSKGDPTHHANPRRGPPVDNIDTKRTGIGCSWKPGGENIKTSEECRSSDIFFISSYSFSTTQLQSFKDSPLQTRIMSKLRFTFKSHFERKYAHKLRTG